MMNENSYGNTSNHNEEFDIPQRSSNVINVSWPERMVSATVGTLLLTNGVGNLFRNPLSALVKTAIMVVNKPRNEVYQYWRKLENLPLFMKHLKTVQEQDNTRSHWEALLPGNLGLVKWEAEIVEEEENRKIAWRSVENSMIENAGKVVFEEALGGQGTKLDIIVSYRPPAGDLGRGVAKLLNPMVEKYIREDVSNFKDHIETKQGGSLNVGTSVGHEPVSSIDDQPTERLYR
ncbi:MAG: hypothetical protein K0Q66_1812 [Chitinophagaceae bacterium]|nr:hypothetical protein [Chitinophagaceae bacterium]